MTAVSLTSLSHLTDHREPQGSTYNKSPKNCKKQFCDQQIKFEHTDELLSRFPMERTVAKIRFNVLFDFNSPMASFKSCIGSATSCTNVIHFSYLVSLPIKGRRTEQLVLTIRCLCSLPFSARICSSHFKKPLGCIVVRR